VGRILRPKFAVSTPPNAVIGTPCHCDPNAVEIVAANPPISTPIDAFILPNEVDGGGSSPLWVEIGRINIVLVV